ncbi:DUF4238 domain-containing protein [Mesorhizobium salmacidum]|uniref:DUF4238 domain-containing protein n=1 Tax=Mesorhizobium salmacidum TaxID=3015171 RepID=A0ABU8KYS5_9HYPH
MVQNKPNKHHYIPKFYLKRWSGFDGRLCEFSRPYDHVKPRRTAPDGTGYVRGLYTLRGFEPDLAQQIEERFFGTTDCEASDVLGILETKGPDGASEGPLRSAWSRFLLSLLLRTPENIEGLRAQWEHTFAKTDTETEAEYANVRQPGRPATFAEYLRSMPVEQIDRYLFGVFIPLVDNVRVGTILNKMVWSVFTAAKTRFEFLTSDRPIVRTPLNIPDGYLALPIGPRKLFLATNSLDVIRRFQNANQDRLVADMNARVVGGAIKYVYGSSDTQRQFVSNRMGTEIKSFAIIDPRFPSPEHVQPTIRI